MRSKPFLLAVALLLIGVTSAAIGTINFVSQDNVDNNLTYERYNSLLSSTAKLNPEFSQGEDMSVEEAITIILDLRDRNMEAWQEFIESTEDKKLISNALFYFSLNHYANAVNFEDVESVNRAILGIYSSLEIYPRDPNLGLTEFDRARISFLESALSKKKEIEEKQREQDKQNQEQQEEQASSPVSSEEGGEAGDNGELPKIGPGEQP